MRTLLASLALVLIVAALAAPTVAQTEPRIQITSSVTAVGLHYNKTHGEVAFTVRNLGLPAGSVTLNPSPVDGWRFDFVDAPSFALARDESKTVRLKVTALEEAQNANLVMTGVLVESAPTQRASAPATSEVRLSYVPAPAPVPPPPPPGAPWNVIGSVVGVLLLGLLTLQTGGVKLELSSPSIEVTPAGSGYVRVTVRNRWWPARRVHIRVRDVPSPAVAALSLAKVRLRRGESVNVPLLVKAPVEMPDGHHSLSVQARAGPLGPWMSRRRVQLRFRSPVAPDAPLEALAPIILQN